MASVSAKDSSGLKLVFNIRDIEQQMDEGEEGNGEEDGNSTDAENEADAVDDERVLQEPNGKVTADVEVEDEPETKDPDENMSSSSATVSPSQSPALTADYGITTGYREPRSCTISKEDEETDPLSACLNYLHRILVRKDKHSFFQYPVNDMVAPEYSSIIKKPMDFHTMKTKIQERQYGTVLQFRDDFNLICSNAMQYNPPDSPYNRAAKRLNSVGNKLMSKERLSSMKRGLVFMQSISAEQLGFQPVTETTRPKRDKDKERTISASPTLRAIPDHINAAQVHARCQQAARDAASKLKQAQPNAKLGYLSRNADGSTSFTTLVGNPNSRPTSKSSTGNEGSTQLTQNATPVVGKLFDKVGSGGGASDLTNLPEYKEILLNRVKPLEYLQYGPFSSHMPSYHSSSSTITKSDSDLLLSIYGTEYGVEYAKSLVGFAKRGESDYLLDLADAVLDQLTDGQHSKNECGRRILDRTQNDSEKPSVTPIDEENPVKSAVGSSGEKRSASASPVAMEEEEETKRARLEMTQESDDTNSPMEDEALTVVVDDKTVDGGGEEEEGPDIEPVELTPEDATQSVRITLCQSLAK